MRYEVFVAMNACEPSVFSVLKHKRRDIAEQVLQCAKNLGFTAFIIGVNKS